MIILCMRNICHAKRRKSPVLVAITLIFLQKGASTSSPCKGIIGQVVGGLGKGGGYEGWGTADRKCTIVSNNLLVAACFFALFLCRDTLHKVVVKLRAPLTGHPRRENLHELRVKLPMLITCHKLCAI